MQFLILYYTESISIMSLKFNVGICRAVGATLKKKSQKLVINFTNNYKMANIKHDILTSRKTKAIFCKTYSYIYIYKF